MSSRKRMILKKSWLPDHRKLSSRDLPVCKSKNKVFKYPNTKRTNSIGIHIKTKNTDGDPYFLSELLGESIWVPAKIKGLRVLFKKSSKGQLGSRFYRDEFETSQSMNCVDASYECTLAVLECSTIISILIFRSTKNREIFLFVMIATSLDDLRSPIDLLD